MPSVRLPHTVSDFTVLPISLPPTIIDNTPVTATHYLYLKPYEPKLPDEESSRALLLLNIPVAANEAQIRHLLSTQLKGAHVQHVYFADSASPNQTSSLVATTSKGSPTSETTSNTQKNTNTTLGKRKRPAHDTSQDVEQKLSTYSLPQTLPSQLHVSGSTAIAVFLDRPSRDLTLKAARFVAKSASKSHTSTTISWSAGLDAAKAPPLGLSRYKAQRALTFPARADILRCVDNYMTEYAELEAAKARESAKKRAEPDEDGFVTVTRGSRGVVKADEAEALKLRVLEEKKRKEKEGGLADFYRFQMRDRRREQQGQLVRRFEEERRTVREMGEKRNRGRPLK